MTDHAKEQLSEQSDIDRLLTSDDTLTRVLAALRLGLRAVAWGMLTGAGLCALVVTIAVLTGGFRL